MIDQNKLDEMITNAKAMITALAMTRMRGVTKNHANLIIFNVLHRLDVMTNDLKELKNETKKSEDVC
jgi:hypothetical protein